jgi:predicted RNase H-like nuclease (RuvC/YqgF family)
MENNFILKLEMYGCGLAMSGVEASKEQKEDQLHLCASCMNSVVQTFSHLQGQIARLKREKAKLEEEMMMFRDEQEEQKRVMAEKIRALEEKLALLKKE